MKLIVLAALALLAAVLPGGAALAQGGGTVVGTAYDPAYGTILVDGNGMTLYLFTRDDENVSNCSGGCAVIWPPLTVESEAALTVPEGMDGFGVITRDDGSLQVTYHGWPLYLWVQDQEPGDTTGHGVNDVWWVVNPIPTVMVGGNADLGPFLVDGRGFTLYLFTNDAENVTNCYDNCATAWPPLIVAWGEPTAGPGAGGRLGLIERRDGAKQVTYNGIPLYYWLGDREPGQTNGQNVGGVWFVVEP